MQKTVLIVLLALTLAGIVSLLSGSDFLVYALSFEKNGKISYDLNDDGLTDHVEIWAAGELVAVEQDVNGDGRMDATATFVGDELIRSEFDTDFDGQFDYRERKNERGEPIAEVLRDGQYQLLGRPAPATGP